MPSSWDQILRSVLMAFRMSTSTQSTGSYPCYMLFGKEIPLPIDAAL